MIDIKNTHVLHFADIYRASDMRYLALDYVIRDMVKSGMVQVHGYRGSCDCFLIWREAGKLHFRSDSYNKAVGTSNMPHRVSVVCVNNTFAFADLPPLENVTPFDLALAKDGHPIEDVVGNPVKFIAHVPEAHVTSQVVYMNYDGKIMTCTTSGYNSGHRVLKMKVPEDRLAYVNIYQPPFGKRRFSTLFSSEETAKSKASIAPTGWKYIATAKVEWKE